MSDANFQQADQAASQVADLTRASADLESKLREAVTSRVQNNPLYQQRDAAAANFISAPGQIRTDLARTAQTNPLSPTQQGSIESSRRANAAVPLISLNDLVGSLTGGMETAVKGGLGAFDSIYNSAIQKAELLRRQAQDQFEREKFAAGQQPSFLEQFLMDQIAKQSQQPIPQPGDFDFIGPTRPTQSTYSTFVPDDTTRTEPTGQNAWGSLNIGNPLKGISNFLGNLLGGGGNTRFPGGA